MSLIRSIALLCVLATPAIGIAQGAPRPAAPDVVVTGSGASGLSRAIRDRVEAFSRSRGLGLHDLLDRPPRATDSAARLKEAIASYHGFKYAEALKKLDALVEEVARTGAADLEPQELADVFVYRAMSKTEAGAGDDPRADLLRAASLFPSYKLDEARFRPSLVAAFERARVSASQEPNAVIDIDVERGCAVIINARRIGATAITLRPGVHYVQVRCTSSLPFASTETFIAGRQRYTPGLTPRPNDRDRALAAGRRDRLIWVALSRLEAGRVDIEIVRRSTRKSLRTYTKTIDGESAVDQIADILESAINDEFSAPVPPPEIIIREPRRRFYKEPWFWALVGATTASAIILPLSLRDSTATGWGTSISGLP